MKRILFLVTFFFSYQVSGTTCDTLELAKQGLADYSATATYPLSGTYTAQDFDGLESVETSHQNFCHMVEEDCYEADVDFGMDWSFQPGLRGWIGINKSCQVDFGITFRD